MKSTRLKFTNFKGPFVSHGIDVIADPELPTAAVYIFAVNHQPDPKLIEPECQADPAKCKSNPKAQSQIELFHHVLGSSSVKHVRTIRHPIITMPNDICAQSPNSFFVTNDHYYRDGLIRDVEDVLAAAKWTTTIHVGITDLKANSADAGINTTVALKGIHNNNGLGHGQSDDEILVNSAMSGVMYRGVTNGPNRDKINIVDAFQFDSTIDNPSYFSDPYRTDTFDASGYINAGLRNAADLGKNKGTPNAKDGVMVWYTKKTALNTSGKETRKAKKGQAHLLFQDDGSRIRTASAAVLVAIKPKPKEAKREAWLFVTGFLSNNVIAVKVDLV
jgi:hypothetical protein